MAPTTRARKGKSDDNKGRKDRRKDSHQTNLASSRSEDNIIDNPPVIRAITEQQQVDEDEIPESISFNQSKEDAYKMKVEYSKMKQQIKDIRKEKQNKHQAAMQARNNSMRQELPLDVLKAALRYKNSVKNSNSQAPVGDLNRKQSNSVNQTRNKKLRKDAKKLRKGLAFVDISKDKTVKVSDKTSKFLANRLYGTRITRKNASTVISNQYKIRGYRPALQFRKSNN